MTSSSQAPNAEQLAQIEAVWSRYRRFITGLTGLQGEILAAHLTIESEIETRLSIMLPHPEIVLDGAGFAQKLKLLIGLWPGSTPLDGPDIALIKRLNKLRNMIAHGDDDAQIGTEIDKLLVSAAALTSKTASADEQRIDALRHMTMRLCGFVVGATEGSAYDGLNGIRLRSTK